MSHQLSQPPFEIMDCLMNFHYQVWDGGGIFSKLFGILPVSGQKTKKLAQPYGSAKFKNKIGIHIAPFSLDQLN